MTVLATRPAPTVDRVGPLPVTALVLSDGTPDQARGTAVSLEGLVERVVVLERSRHVAAGGAVRQCEWQDGATLAPVVASLTTPWMLVLSAGEALVVHDLAAAAAELGRMGPCAVELDVAMVGSEVRLHAASPDSIADVGGRARLRVEQLSVCPLTDQAQSAEVGTTRAELLQERQAQSARERSREQVVGLEERRLLEVVRGGRTVCWTEDSKDLQPLVTVRIATYDRGADIVDRAVKSALEQTYPNIEVLVVGDGCDTKTAEGLTEMAQQDPRVTFINLPTRGIYPDDPQARWMVAGAAPMNAALHLARGAWLAPCDDDDELTPDHVEVLLRHAKEHQLEMVWSKALFQRPDGSWDTIGSTPLREGEVSHGSVLYSLGLRFFQHNATSWQIPEPGDWNLWRRMSAAGVRTGFLDQVTYRHYCDEVTQEPNPRGEGSNTSRRLHLGCGPNRFAGWSNIDIEAEYEPDVLHDLSKGIPAADASCELIYSEHVFEHFPLETGMMLMRESLRALRPGGVLRIAMPDLEHVVRKYSTSWRDQAWLDTPGLEYVDSACRMLNVGLREWGHTYVYDEEDLRMRLRQSGFTDIRRCELGRSDVPGLRGLETRADSLLVLEAVAP